jgi:hypothetical protein
MAAAPPTAHAKATRLFKRIWLAMSGVGVDGGRKWLLMWGPAGYGYFVLRSSSFYHKVRFSAIAQSDYGREPTAEEQKALGLYPLVAADVRRRGKRKARLGSVRR